MLTDPDESPEVPENNAIDPVSGYSLLIPAVEQGYPCWWRAEPDKYQALVKARGLYNIRIDDGIETYELGHADLVRYYANAVG